MSSAVTRCRTLVLGVVCLVMACRAGAQSFEETFNLTPRSLSLREAVALVLDRNLDARIEWMNWLVADQGVRGAWARFEPSLSMGYNTRESRLPQNAQEFVSTGGLTPGQRQVIINQQILINQLDDLNNQLQGKPASSSKHPQPEEAVPPPLTEPNVFRSDTIGAGLALGGKLPLGTEYKFYLDSTELRNDINRYQPPSIFYPEYVSTAGFSLTQPLLRDFGFSSGLAEVRVTRKNRVLADLAWEQQITNAIAGVILDYFDLTFATENVEVKRGTVAFAQTLVSENEKRLKIGLLSPADVQEAEVAVSLAREDVINALSFALEKQAGLKQRTLGGLQDDLGVVFVPSDPLPIIAPPLDRDALVALALARRADHRSLIADAEKQEIVLKFARNQLLPRLDLQATLSLNGLAGSRGDSMSRAFDRQGHEALVGVQLTIPLGNVGARASYKAAQLRQQQAVLAIARSEVSISVEIETLIGRVKTYRAKLDTARESARLSEKLLDTEQKRLAQGLADSFDVLKARRELADARTREIAALADYNKAAVQLWLASGTLLEKQGIRIDRSTDKPLLQHRPDDAEIR